MNFKQLSNNERRKAMKTLTDLKKQAIKYTWEMTFNSWFGGELKEGHKFYKLKRTVGKVQSNSLAFNFEGKLSWLDWPKASEMTLSTNDNIDYTLVIKPKDKRDCEIHYKLELIK